MLKVLSDTFRSGPIVKHIWISKNISPSSTALKVLSDVIRSCFLVKETLDIKKDKPKLKNSESSILSY